MSFFNRATMQSSAAVSARPSEHAALLDPFTCVGSSANFRLAPSNMIIYMTWHFCAPPAQRPWFWISDWNFSDTASGLKGPLLGPYQSIDAPSIPRCAISRNCASTVATLFSVYSGITLLLQRGTDAVPLESGVGQKPGITLAYTFVAPVVSNEWMFTVETLPPGPSNNGVSMPVAVSRCPANAATQSVGEVALPATQVAVLFAVRPVAVSACTRLFVPRISTPAPASMMTAVLRGPDVQRGTRSLLFGRFGRHVVRRVGDMPAGSGPDCPLPRGSIRGRRPRSV